jgi:hypothetical protein
MCCHYLLKIIFHRFGVFISVIKSARIVIEICSYVCTNVYTTCKENDEFYKCKVLHTHKKIFEYPSEKLIRIDTYVINPIIFEPSISNAN